MNANLTLLLRIAGLMHYGILIASAMVPQVLDWRADLRKLHPLTRQLVWVHGAFIVLTILALGTIATINAPVLATSNALLPRSVCAVIAIFWGTRLILQFAFFDPSHILCGRPALRIGYHGLTLVFLFIVASFGYAAIHGG
jgi:hypothetical protein